MISLWRYKALSSKSILPSSANIQTEANVDGILVNIFGGIVRCDLIAEGILQAIEKVGRNSMISSWRYKALSSKSILPSSANKVFSTVTISGLISIKLASLVVKISYRLSKVWLNCSVNISVRLSCWAIEALYRHKGIIELRDTSQEDEKEKEAGEYQLNYISLDGTIGCMVNGAGLAMATMDLIEHHGGSPANFLDVGGGTTAQRVAKAFELIQTEANVGGILVNIFGGIVRCDLIAEGILQAIEKVGLSLPIVVRLEGTNAQQGLALLSGSKYNIYTEANLTQAAIKIVALSQEQSK
jgi:succinyl-CoA synthetase beta subunit